MKIKKVVFNNRKKAFEITTAKGTMEFPYSKLHLKPSADNPVREAFPDPEIGNHGFTYRLASGEEDTLPLDAVLEYNKDPDYMRKMMLHKLTIQAQKVIASSGISKREIMRRLGTSPTQFYRLVDQTFYGKTIDQMVRLLTALDCPVNITFDVAA